MRRLFAAAMVCAAFLLFAGVAVAGAAPSPTTHKDGGASAAAQPTLAGHRALSGSWMAQKPRFIPAPEALASAAAAINGTIRDFYGSGLASARVDWYVGSSATGHGFADATGSFAFSDIPAAAGNGEITALSSDENTWFDWWNLNWSSPGPTTFDMQPGAVSVYGSTGGPWGPVGRQPRHRRLHVVGHGEQGSLPVLPGLPHRVRARAARHDRGHGRVFLQQRGRRGGRLQRPDRRGRRDHPDERNGRRVLGPAYLDGRRKCEPVQAVGLRQARVQAQAVAPELPARLDEPHHRLLAEPVQLRPQDLRQLSLSRVPLPTPAR